MSNQDPSRSADQPTRVRLVRPGAALLCLGLVALVAGSLAWAVRPPSRLMEGPRLMEIPTSLGLLGIARSLADQEVIRSRAAFVSLAVVRGTARSLKAGEYEVPQGASLLAVLQMLEAGRVKPRLLVLPEGFTIRELARQIEAEGLAPAAEVIRVASNPMLAGSLGIDASSVEGYLFPDTYQVIKGTRVEELLGRMVQRFRDKAGTPDVVERARQRGLTPHQLVTLASIVEKEAALAEERPIIARVFLNRLE